MKITLMATVISTLKKMFALTFRWSVEFGFEVKISGSRLRTKVSEATMTGWKCRRVVARVVEMVLCFPLTLLPVNLMTRTVPPVISFMSTISLTRKQTPPLSL